MLMQEVSVWNKLDHPNVAKFVGATEFISNLNVTPRLGKTRKPNYAACIVAEYVDGGTLASYLKHHKNKKLPFINVVIQFALDVAKGLSYLHSQEIVHRDVKAENLLLDHTRRVKIIDFGISRSKPSNLSEMTGGMGTKGYIALEVFSYSPYVHKCDVHIQFWEIYCCKKVECHMSFIPIIPDDCPSKLANLMKRCWDGDPKRRSEMAEVVKILEAMDAAIDEERKQTYKPGWFYFSRT